MSAQRHVQLPQHVARALRQTLASLRYGIFAIQHMIHAPVPCLANGCRQNGWHSVAVQNRAVSVPGLHCEYHSLSTTQLQPSAQQVGPLWFLPPHCCQAFAQDGCVVVAAAVVVGFTVATLLVVVVVVVVEAVGGTGPVVPGYTDCVEPISPIATLAKVT
eukprot:s770_g5.t1